MVEQHNKSQHSFIEVAITGNEQAWCVDGRRDLDNHEPGPHMLGASLHPIVLAAIYQGEVFAKESVHRYTQALRDAGYKIGVHYGSHQNQETGASDCGFADNLARIIQKAVSTKEEVFESLLSVYRENTECFKGVSEADFSTFLAGAFEKISSYPVENLQCIGAELIRLEEEEEHAVVEHLGGEHEETVCYVNLKPNVTFDTNKVNDAGSQAFNLDLWAVVEQSKVLSVDEDFAVGASLILYAATEKVLVEDKGKQALPVAVHS